MQFYAHSKEGAEPTDWQPLEQHLTNVANLAEEFAQPFGGGDWARLVGSNHDLGKGTFPWQAWLRYVNSAVDEFARYYEGHPIHADVGAQWLYQHSQQAGKLLAYCVAGHHGGLPNWCESMAETGLKARLRKEHPVVEVSASNPDCPVGLPFPVDGERFGFQLGRL